MATGISWKDFEALVGRLEKAFGRGRGIVTTNEKIQGKISGRSRQIDVCIRGDIGGESILIIVECKKWNRKADVKAVEAFSGVKKDVGAHIGIMVSTAGFSKAAYRTAENESINLYRYADTQKGGWPNGLEGVMHFRGDKAVHFDYHQALRLGWHIKHEARGAIIPVM